VGFVKAENFAVTNEKGATIGVLIGDGSQITVGANELQGTMILYR
jgi:hypothetical protein